ncbi:hypothetical protein AN168_16245 [Vibrio splendidus]|uniref:Uncharacterized protein n=1 Tax=Vibrio splendidus TaxID=29497 RepID=A0A837NML8_VIBSP|nr:hypothetical protein AN168_16245 [Vibrio splendidus]
MIKNLKIIVLQAYRYLSFLSFKERTENEQKRKPHNIESSIEGASSMFWQRASKSIEVIEPLIKHDLAEV